MPRRIEKSHPLASRWLVIALYTTHNTVQAFASYATNFHKVL